ncbi:hypothetical protein M758_1G037400 [Ceratodon purpureus]|nr:hypothetical protein M758_1G037400 [Ceratodon purpureus]
MLASVCAESGAMDPLFRTYIVRMKVTMQRMCSNILDADKVNPPKRTESGRLWTPAGVDLFRLLNEQVKVVQETSTDVMLFHVAVAINQLMQEFQEAEKWRLQEHPLNVGLENLCAMVNNNVRCHEMTNDMSTSILEDLPLSYVEQVNFDDVSQGFLAVAKFAVQHAVRVIFEDPGVKELLVKLYQKGEPSYLLFSNIAIFIKLANLVYSGCHTIQIKRDYELRLHYVSDQYNQDWPI